MDTLNLTPRTGIQGAGIYEAGDIEQCYVKLFVTDKGFVLPVNHRVISEDDLLEVYSVGRKEGYDMGWEQNQAVENIVDRVQVVEDLTDRVIGDLC